MKKCSALVFAVLLIGVWSVACVQRVVVQDTGPEILLPGQFVESVDEAIDMVRCQGKGPDQPTAMIQARKGCLEWMITEKLAQAPAERRAYLASQKQIMAKLDRYVAIPKPGPRSGTGEGVKSQVRIDANQIKVELITKVFKKQLKADLVDLGIIASADEIADSIGNPTMMVVPFAASKGNKFRGMIEGLLNSYLTKAQYEVLSSSGQKDLDKMITAFAEAAEAEEDEAAAIARAVGADIFIKFEGKKMLPEGGGQEVAYGVRIEAYETTTAKMLGSEQKTSPTRVTWRAGEEMRALEEALRDAMAQVMPQITAYWKKDAPKGNRYFVVFKDAPRRTDMKMSKVLKKACTKVKLQTSTASTVTFRVQCKADNLELASVIDEGIETKMGGAGYNFVAKNRNSIVVQFQ